MSFQKKGNFAINNKGMERNLIFLIIGIAVVVVLILIFLGVALINNSSLETRNLNNENQVVNDGGEVNPPNVDSGNVYGEESGGGNSGGSGGGSSGGSGGGSSGTSGSGGNNDVVLMGFFSNFFKKPKLSPVDQQDIYYNNGAVGIGKIPDVGRHKLVVYDDSNPNDYASVAQFFGVLGSVKDDDIMLSQSTARVTSGNHHQIIDKVIRLSDGDTTWKNTEARIQFAIDNSNFGYISSKSIDGIANPSIAIGNGNNNDQMIITPDGKIGIGTPDPKSILHIIQKDSIAGIYGLTVDNIDASNPFTETRLLLSGLTNSPEASMQFYAPNGAGSEYIRFIIKNSDEQLFADSLTIDRTGKVGISNIKAPTGQTCNVKVDDKGNLFKANCA